jgi:hypothetical protein
MASIVYLHFICNYECQHGKLFLKHSWKKEFVLHTYNMMKVPGDVLKLSEDDLKLMTQLINNIYETGQ